MGASVKLGTNARGFRGVGRLAGLGYCRRLVFRSRSAEDSTPTEVAWDSREFKRILADRCFTGGVEDVVRDIVRISSLPAAGYPERFFEVELDGVVRLRNDILLNVDEVRRYLVQTAPLPFSGDFAKADVIREALCGLVPEPAFEIRVMNILKNGDSAGEATLCRPHAQVMMAGGDRTETVEIEEIEEIEPLYVPGPEGKPAAVGWIAHHADAGALTAFPEVKGLRARVGDIRVGGHDLFAEVFPEERFNSWTIGEIHVLDPRIRPNGRRDGFEVNQHYSDFTNRLLPYTREIAHRCRRNSAVRARFRTFEIEEKKATDAVMTLEQAAADEQAMRELTRVLASALDSMGRVCRDSLLDGAAVAALQARLDVLTERGRAAAGSPFRRACTDGPAPDSRSGGGIRGTPCRGTARTAARKRVIRWQPRP
jgi:hypothetical protein